MLISRAIAKHGVENFRIEVLCSANSWTEICAAEPILIAERGTRFPSGYNLSKGGEGPFGVKHTAEAIERSAAKHRGKPCHPNTRVAASRTHKGVKKSPEHRARIAAGKRGKPRNEATRQKIAAYWAARRADGEFKTSEPYAHARKMIAKIFPTSSSGVSK